MDPLVNNVLMNGRHAGGLEAYGVDPSFNTHSTLYRPDVLQRMWQFFNASSHSPDVSTSGAPFAFYPRRSVGFADGFPVFFPVLPLAPSSVLYSWIP